MPQGGIPAVGSRDLAFLSARSLSISGARGVDGDGVDYRFCTGLTAYFTQSRLPVLHTPVSAGQEDGLAIPQAAGSVSDELFDLVGGLVGGFVFPDADWGPAGCSQAGVGVGVAGSVAGDLGLPVLGVATGFRAVLGAAVPEAAVHEDRHPQTREHHVGLAAYLGQWPAVHEVAQATPVQCRADESFRSCVARALLRHALRCRAWQRLRLHPVGSTSHVRVAGDA